MPETGEWKVMHTPRSPFDANVRPRSVTPSRAGPAVFSNEYGPVTATAATLARGVRTRQGPYRASRSSSPTSTHARSGVTPKTSASRR